MLARPAPREPRQPDLPLPEWPAPQEQVLWEPGFERRPSRPWSSGRLSLFAKCDSDKCNLPLFPPRKISLWFKAWLLKEFWGANLQLVRRYLIAGQAFTVARTQLWC